MYLIQLGSRTSFELEFEFQDAASSKIGGYILRSRTSFSLEKKFLETSRYFSRMCPTPKYYCFHPGTLCKCKMQISKLNTPPEATRGSDKKNTSDLTTRCVQNLFLEKETRPRTEAFKSHHSTEHS